MARSAFLYLHHSLAHQAARHVRLLGDGFDGFWAGGGRTEEGTVSFKPSGVSQDLFEPWETRCRLQSGANREDCEGGVRACDLHHRQRPRVSNYSATFQHCKAMKTIVLTIVL